MDVFVMHVSTRTVRNAVLKAAKRAIIFDSLLRQLSCPLVQSLHWVTFSSIFVAFSFPFFFVNSVRTQQKATQLHWLSLPSLQRCAISPGLGLSIDEKAESCQSVTPSFEQCI